MAGCEGAVEGGGVCECGGEGGGGREEGLGGRGRDRGGRGGMGVEVEMEGEGGGASTGRAGDGVAATAVLVQGAEVGERVEAAGGGSGAEPVRGHRRLHTSLPHICNRIATTCLERGISIAIMKVVITMDTL